MQPAPPRSAPALIGILAACGFASTFAGRAVEPLVAVIALLSAAYALPYALIQPILGPVGDALGKARVMRLCLLVLALALLASAWRPARPRCSPCAWCPARRPVG